MCTLCTAPAVGQLLLKSSYPAHCVGPSFLVRDTTADCGRKRNNLNIHTPRSSAESTRNVHRNIYRLLPCVPRSRKLLLLLLLLCSCNVRIRTSCIMYDWSLKYTLIRKVGPNIRRSTDSERTYDKHTRGSA